MSVYTGVTCCADEALFTHLFYVIALGVEVILRETEVDEVDDLVLVASAEDEVVGLDVTVDQAQ